jgi:hypothetical protein
VECGANLNTHKIVRIIDTATVLFAANVNLNYNSTAPIAWQ